MFLQDTQKLQFAAADGYSLSGTHIDGYAVTTNFTSAPFFLGRVEYYVLGVISTTGATSATLKIQGSVDKSSINSDQPDANLQNWYDLGFINPSTGAYSTTQTLSGTGMVAFEEISCGYRWVRLVYTNSVAGTITAKIQFKGIGH